MRTTVQTTPTPGRRCITAAALALATLALVAALLCRVAVADDASRQALVDNGLINLGDAWLAPAEMETRQWLDALDPLERQYQALLRAIDDRVRANESVKAELAQQRRELKKLVERIDANDPAALGPTRDRLKQSAKELEAHIKRLRSDYKDGTHLAEFQPARDDVIRLANARAALTLAAAALRRNLTEMPEQYDRIAKIPAVRAALSQLGPTIRLGTGRNYATDAADRLARIDRATQSDFVPVYRDDNHARVLAIVDGATPITFSLRHSAGPTHLPHSLVASLNISTEDAPRVTYTVGDRKLACRRVKLSSLRVGSLEMRDVEALALPPEGEDLGAKLGRAAYESHYLDVDFSHLRLTVMTSAPQENTPKLGDGSDGGAKNSRRMRANSPAAGSRSGSGR
ncbi:MAG: aspartyl protease family protein [Pirellulales bacterium]